MSRFRPWLLLTAMGLFGVTPAFATNFVVGTCKPGLTSFPTISAAVAAAPAGTTIYVCPGTYAEQITISEPLTLQGVGNGNSGQVVITATGGVRSNATTVGGSPLAAQIAVTAGPVNISQVTIDGMGNGLFGSIPLAGIYYGSGASGVISNVTTRNQLNESNGIGIFAENGNSTSESVTITGNSVHDFDATGIWLNGNVNATVQGNSVSSANVSEFTYGILVGYPVATTTANLTRNILTGPGASLDAQGLTVMTSTTAASSNMFTGWYFAAVDFGAASYSTNSVQSSTIAFYLGVPGATIQTNSITQTFAAVDFNCVGATVYRNVVNDANIALYEGFATPNPQNDFFNVATIQNLGCGANVPAVSKKHGAPRVDPKTIKN